MARGEQTTRIVIPVSAAQRPYRMPTLEEVSEEHSHRGSGSESVIELYETELIRRRGPCRTAEKVKLTLAQWVTWWNQRRLQSATSNLPSGQNQPLYDQRRAAAEVV